MVDLAAWGNEYVRKARITPGLLALAPIAIVIASVGIRKIPAISIGSVLLITIGAPLLLANYVRLRGAAAQDVLVAKWGSMPATEMLRLSAPENPVRTKSVWRPAVEQLTEITLPSRKQEMDHPATADQTIAAAIEQLIQVMRMSEAHSRIQHENISYGFNRNLYALRWLGRTVAATAILVLSFVAAISTALRTDCLIGALVSLCWLCVWFTPSASSVRTAGMKYASELFNSAAGMARTIAQNEKKKGTDNE